jgi:hypothetical protein
MFGLREAKSHIQDAVLGATLCMSPFPHAVVDQVFPAEIYEKLVQFNPFKRNSGTEWISKRRRHAYDENSASARRLQIDFHRGEYFEAEENEKKFWLEIADLFLHDNFFPSILYDLFPVYFELRFGDAVNDVGFWASLKRELFVQRHEPGYFITPHTDAPTRVCVCIFSLADRSGFDQYGTALLKPKNPSWRCWGHKHHRPEDFETVKIAPYRPNSLLIFFKTRQSFHSVPQIAADVPNGRYGMQFQLYEPGSGLFEDLSRPDLMTKPEPA